MVHIIFPVTWAALPHYYLPVLPTVEWDYPPTTSTSSLLSKVSYQSGSRSSYSSISSLNDWLSPASSLSHYTPEFCACTKKYSGRENGQVHRHKPTGLLPRSQLRLLLLLCLNVRVCSGPVPLFNFFRVKLVLMSLNGVCNLSR